MSALQVGRDLMAAKSPVLGQIVHALRFSQILLEMRFEQVPTDLYEQEYRVLLPELSRM